MERLAPNRQPLSIQLQFVQLPRSTATGTGLQVQPAFRHNAAKSPPAYGTSFQVCCATGSVSSTRSYHGSRLDRLMERGHNRRPTEPRREKTNDGARSAAAK